MRCRKVFLPLRSHSRTVSPRKPIRKRKAKSSKAADKSRRKKSARRPSGRGHTSISGPPVRDKSVGALFEDLVVLQARLRAPGGCPWDREQTHKTLRPYLIEEAYEVLEAIDQGETAELAAELGDLLLQVVFHAQLAHEAGRFDISTVISGIHNKMVYRHPHVFGKVRADTSAQVLKNWDELKAREKRGRKQPGRKSILDDVPRSLPALLEAYQLTRRAAKVGFDWEDVKGILEKLDEETRELNEELALDSREMIENELGDMLFVVVNLVRMLGFDPEVVLKKSNRKFKSRFQLMEIAVLNLNKGRRLAEHSKEELEVLWETAKSRSGLQTGSKGTSPK